MTKIIEPSLLSFDLSKIESQLNELKRLGIRQIHYDVMDNKFVPNKAFGTEWLDLIHKLGLTVSVHFMVENPLEWIKRFIEYKAIKAITFHAEPISFDQSIEIINFIKSHNILAGIALRPTTDFNKYSDLLKKCDLVTVLGVQPGFGGQKFMDITINNLIVANKIKDESDHKLIIQLDGGVNFEVIKSTYKYVDWFVSGSFLMKYQGNKKDIINYLNLLQSK